MAILNGAKSRVLGSLAELGTNPLVTGSWGGYGLLGGGLGTMALLPTNISLFLYFNNRSGCSCEQQLNIGAMWFFIKINPGFLLHLRQLEHVKLGVSVYM
mgnify:CR=1 FL=1